MSNRLYRHHAAAAALLAVLTITVGITWCARVAGGADSYGYVSQADLWLRGNLFIDQSFGANVPWPLARWTFNPLGYRPEADGYRIVPLYSPGLPMLMAAAKAIAGQCALFWVVPLTGGVLVFSTYWIGRQMRRPIVGLAAAFIVATSPAMLFMLVAPMSDVPAAAAWAGAVALLVSGAPIAAGFASALAILIRPNLVPLAAVLMVFSLVTIRSWRSLLFGAAAATGAIVIAIINARLYGSALASGYGDLSTAYSWSFILPNLRRYLTWLVSAETPLALAGLLALYVPGPPEGGHYDGGPPEGHYGWSSSLWPTSEARRIARLLAAVAAVVWISYIVYVPWDAWWYLRFLLPAWPAMAIGTASLLSVMYRRRSAGMKYAAAGVVALLGVSGVVQAAHRDVFAMADGEMKYIETARVVETLASPDDVIITDQYSGSLRYYAGRLTLRWDFIEPNWLDDSVQWLSEHGHHVYILLEEGEIEQFRARFGPASAVGALNWTPAVTFRGGAVRLWDAANRDRAAAPVEQAPLRAIKDCPVQRPSPQLR